jgi:hypothetical protein
MNELDPSRLQWRKSSRSGGNGGDCVELAMAWRKFRRSSGNGGNRVEVVSAEQVIAVRDSKDPDGPVLTFTPRVWRAFTISVPTR